MLDGRSRFTLPCVIYIQYGMGRATVRGRAGLRRVGRHSGIPASKACDCLENRRRFGYN